MPEIALEALKGAGFSGEAHGRGTPEYVQATRVWGFSPRQALAEPPVALRPRGEVVHQRIAAYLRLANPMLPFWITCPFLKQAPWTAAWLSSGRKSKAYPWQPRVVVILR